MKDSGLSVSTPTNSSRRKTLFPPLPSRQQSHQIRWTQSPPHGGGNLSLVHDSRACGCLRSTRERNEPGRQRTEPRRFCLPGQVTRDTARGTEVLVTSQPVPFSVERAGNCPFGFNQLESEASPDSHPLPQGNQLSVPQHGSLATKPLPTLLEQ